MIRIVGYKYKSNNAQNEVSQIVCWMSMLSDNVGDVWFKNQSYAELHTLEVLDCQSVSYFANFNLQVS